MIPSYSGYCPLSSLMGAGVVRSGEAFFGATTWRGQRATRVSVCHWQTSDSDVERAVGAVSRVLGAGE